MFVVKSSFYIFIFKIAFTLPPSLFLQDELVSSCYLNLLLYNTWPLLTYYTVQSQILPNCSLPLFSFTAPCAPPQHPSLPPHHPCPYPIPLPSLLLPCPKYVSTPSEFSRISLTLKQPVRNHSYTQHGQLVNISRILQG